MKLLKKFHKKKQQATAKASAAPRIINWSRWSLYLVGLLLLSAVVWGYQLLHDAKRFPITRIRVVGGDKHMTRSQLQQAILPWVQDGFFNVNVRRLRHALSDLPWVADAEVQRVWPSEVVIKVYEQNAIATWNGRALLNEQGEVFTPDVDSFPSGLVQLQGPRSQSLEVVQAMQQMDKIISKLGLHITQLQLSLRHSWKIHLNNGMTVILGQKNSLERLQRFVRVYPKLFANAPQTVEYVDLRYSNGIAVKWR